MKKLFILCLIVLCYFGAKAQDLINKKDKTVIKAVLVEIGSEDIKYREYFNQSGPVLTIKKSDVIKIKTEKGKEILFEQNNTQSFDKKNAIKTGVFAWALSQATFSYERSLKPGRSLEIHLGVIGVWALPEDVSDLFGLYTRVGYKFIRPPEYYIAKGKEAHLLKGGYIRPEVTFGYFDETKTYYYPQVPSWWGEDITTRVTFFALVLNIGKQWVIGDDFLIDGFFGAGVGGNSGEKREDNYAVAGPSPVFLNAGLKIGVLW